MPEWTEGVCGDGAAILRDGEMVPIEDVIATLNNFEGTAAEAVSEMARQLGIAQLSKREAKATPLPFRDLLISIARSAATVEAA